MAETVRTYKLYKDVNNTPDNPDDDEFVGWLVYGIYDQDPFGHFYYAFQDYYDKDQNKVDSIDYDRAELIAEFSKNGGATGTPTPPESIINKPKARNQIAEIEARMKQLRSQMHSSYNKLDPDSVSFRFRRFVGDILIRTVDVPKIDEYVRLAQIHEDLTTLGRAKGYSGAIPFYGSGRNTIVDYQQGKYGWAAFNGVLTVSDVLLIRSIAKGGFRLIFTSSDDAIKTGLSNIDNTAGNTHSINSCAIEATDSLTHQGGFYEVLSEQFITGTYRGAHRNSANKAFIKLLESTPRLNEQYSKFLGVDDLASQMRLGKGKDLLNPIGTVWHHPINNPRVMQLLRREVHRHPQIQGVLHPGPNGSGGYGIHY